MKRQTTWIATWLLLLLFLFTGCGSEPQSRMVMASGAEMKVTYIDIGQGDATLIQTQKGTMLIDTGEYGEREQLLAALSGAGVTTIDYLILTHPDADHIGAGKQVIENYPVEAVIMPDIERDTWAYIHAMDAIETENIEVISPVVGDEYQLGDARFVIISPAVVDAENTNESSVGIKLTHGKNVFLFCGDAEKGSERAMVSGNIDLECDVLKCSHHGSRTATSEVFLEAADPTWAVISCGEDNQYGLPHSEVVARLEDDDVQIYRTDKMGNIEATSDGENIFWKSGSEVTAATSVQPQSQPEAETGVEVEEDYVLNLKSKKIHRPECASVAEIMADNRGESNQTKAQLEAEGYSGCGRCNP